MREKTVITYIRLAEAAHKAAQAHARRKKMPLARYLRQLLELHFVGEPVITYRKKRPLDVGREQDSHESR